MAPERRIRRPQTFFGRYGPLNRNGRRERGRDARPNQREMADVTDDAGMRRARVIVEMIRRQRGRLQPRSRAKHQQDK